MSRAAAAVPIIVADSWAQLIDELYEDCWDPGIERFRSPFVFRGVSDARGHLSTSLTRLATGHKELARLESHMLRNFRKYAHESEVPRDSIWNWLALAQHHGLQTRLLDWTYSPFVAMHFATEFVHKFNRDGAIWCVNHHLAVRFLPPKLCKLAEVEGSNVFTVEMLHECASSLTEFDHISKKPFVVYLEPPSFDARIVNQFALFSLMSSPDARLDEWLGQHPGLARKIIIPARLKREVRDKLDQANITERMLYPGLDGLSRWLSRYYTPSTRK